MYKRQVAEKLLSPPRNFPVGVRTAETMTASCMYSIVRGKLQSAGPKGPALLRKLNPADRAITKQRRQPLFDERHRPLDLLVPCRVLRGHIQHAVAQIDRRSTIDGGPHGDTPGKRDFVACERHPAQDSFESPVYHLLNGNHAREDSIERCD